MGKVTDGAEHVNGPPQADMQHLQDAARADQYAARENAYLLGGSPPGGGGGGGQSGNSGGSNDYPTRGQLDWTLAMERSRLSNGEHLTIATVGYRGYILSVNDPIAGKAHITGHVDGTLHRHQFMSDKSPKDDKIKSNQPYVGNLSIIGTRNPKA